MLFWANVSRQLHDVALAETLDLSPGLSLRVKISAAAGTPETQPRQRILEHLLESILQNARRRHVLREGQAAGERTEHRRMLHTSASVDSRVPVLVGPRNLELYDVLGLNQVLEGPRHAWVCVEDGNQGGRDAVDGAEQPLVRAVAAPHLASHQGGRLFARREPFIDPSAPEQRPLDARGVVHVRRRVPVHRRAHGDLTAGLRGSRASELPGTDARSKPAAGGRATRDTSPTKLFKVYNTTTSTPHSTVLLCR